MEKHFKSTIARYEHALKDFYEKTNNIGWTALPKTLFSRMHRINDRFVSKCLQLGFIEENEKHLYKWKKPDMPPTRDDAIKILAALNYDSSKERPVFRMKTLISDLQTPELVEELKKRGFKGLLERTETICF